MSLIYVEYKICKILKKSWERKGINTQSYFPHNTMKSLDYVSISQKTNISIANRVNFTFNIYCNLVITHGYIGSLE
jgi:hypothetical protein